MPSTSFSIIRIAGTAYSGSTVLDLMLANADDVFSCGEIFALIRPYRMHHFTPECGCGDPSCKIWGTIHNAGESGWPEAIVDLFPQTNWIIDSSKDLNWIFDQNTTAASNNIPVHNLLIWKTPEDYAYARMKRGKLRGWLRAYLHYHERYLTIVDDWISVPYVDLVTQPATTLKSLCMRLGMACEEGREQYWRRQHHTLFGSFSAKLHLYGKKSHNYCSIAENRWRFKPGVKNGKDIEATHHKSIYYQNSSMVHLPVSVLRQIEKNQALQDIVSHMQCRNSYEITVESSTTNSASAQLINNIPGVWYRYQHYRRLASYLSCIVRRTYKRP